MSLVQLCIIAIVAALIGSAVGYLAQEWLLRALEGLLRANLPPPDWLPLGLGFITAIALLAGFALPPLLQLSRVPAIRVLRRDMEPPPPVLWLAFGPAIAAVIFLVWWVVRDARLFVGFTVGLTVFTAVLALAGWAMVRLAGSMRGSVGVSWRYGIAIESSTRRKRGADRRLRSRHHGLVTARRRSQRSAHRLATKSSRESPEFLFHQYSTR